MASQEMAATWRNRSREMQEQVTHNHVQEGEQVAMHMRQTRLEMLAAGIAVHPRLLVRREVAQVYQEEAVKHEGPMTRKLIAMLFLPCMVLCSDQRYKES